MIASERLKALGDQMAGSREGPLDLESPLGRDLGQGWDLSHPMEIAIKDVLRALPQIIALVEVAEYLAPAYEITVDTRYRGLHLKGALAALDEALAGGGDE